MNVDDWTLVETSDWRAGMGVFLVAAGFLCLYLALDIAFRPSSPVAGIGEPLDAHGHPSATPPAPAGAADDLAPATEVASSATGAPVAEEAERLVAEIRFGFNSIRFEATTAAAQLEPLLDRLRARPCRRLLLEGHADGVGLHRDNLDLAFRRADAVRRWLIGQGVRKGRIVIRSFGAYQPKPSAAPTAGEQRRVEVSVLDCPNTESST